MIRTPRPLPPLPGLDPPSRRGDACRCAGCQDDPWPDCAACGAPALVALRDPDFPHSMPLCRACLQVVLDSRQGVRVGRPPSTSPEAIRHRQRRADPAARQREQIADRQAKQRMRDAWRRAPAVPA